MAVFVDDARIPWRGLEWSHLVAHTAEELHIAAAALGISQARAQSRGRTLHYDLPEPLRREAIARGVATPISWRELVGLRAHIARGRRGGAAGGGGGGASQVADPPAAAASG